MFEDEKKAFYILHLVIYIDEFSGNNLHLYLFTYLLLYTIKVLNASNLHIFFNAWDTFVTFFIFAVVSLKRSKFIPIFQSSQFVYRGISIQSQFFSHHKDPDTVI